MLFARMESRRERKETERIDALRREREKSRDALALLGSRIQKLVEKSVAGDSLDEKVNACEYRILKEEQAAEQAHLEDLNQAIERLSAARRTRERQQTLREIAEMNDTVDVDKMIEKEDYIAACREYAREEERAYREAAHIMERPALERPEDEEFHRLVERAKLEKTMTAVNTKTEEEKPEEIETAAV